MTNNNDFAEVTARWEELDRTYRMLQDDLAYYDHIGDEVNADATCRVMQDMIHELLELDNRMLSIQNA